MRADELCTRRTDTCRPDQSLAEAARILWEEDRGAVPVLDEFDKVVGIITDRDICMAACVRSVKSSDVRVHEAMTRRVHVCREEDSIEDAMATMALHQVRRLPVISPDGRLVGILSAHDVIARLGEERAAAILRMMRSIGESGRTVKILGADRSAAASRAPDCQNGGNKGPSRWS